MKVCPKCKMERDVEDFASKHKTNCKHCILCRAKHNSSFGRHKPEHRLKEMKYRLKLKDEVLIKYSSKESLCCSWEDCNISDPDMLTLDHINNNGAEERRIERRTGYGIYRWLKIQGYPLGYRTLCMNHQFKKQLVLGRSNSIYR